MMTIMSTSTTMTSSYTVNGVVYVPSKAHRNIVGNIFLIASIGSTVHLALKTKGKYSDNITPALCGKVPAKQLYAIGWRDVKLPVTCKKCLKELTKNQKRNGEPQ